METIDNTILISPPVQSDGTVIPVVEMEDQEEHGQEPAVEEVDSKVPKAPCVVCYVPVIGVADKTRIFEPLTPEEIEHDKVFQLFLINLRGHIKKGKGRGRKKEYVKQVERFDDLFKDRSIGWDGQGGKSPPLPLCEECKYELMGLMEKKASLEMFDKQSGREEEDEYKMEVTKFRMKMGSCECDYLESGIYDKDKRYHRVRRYIMNTGQKAAGVRKQVDVEEEAVVEEVPQRIPEVVEVPCLICCEILRICPEEENFLKRNENEKVFRWFVYQLQNPQGQVVFPTKLKGGKEKGANEMWDGKDGKSEPLRFCGGCRDGGLMEFFGGFWTKEMFERRARWKRGVRGRMKEAEERFVRSGIYERDPRYFNVRRKVINVLETPRLLLKEVPKMKKKRKAEVEKERLEGMKKKKEEEPPKIMLKFVEERTGIPEIDKIVEQRFRRILPRPSAQQQVVKVIVKQEEKVVEGEKEEEEEEEWPWEDEEDPSVIQVKQEKHVEEEKDLGIDPLELEEGAGAMEVENDNDERCHRNCLLCYKHISKEESAQAPILTNDLNEQNFNSVFILRKMLDVPKERLVGYLGNFGCPGKWVEYCKDCILDICSAKSIKLFLSN